MKNSEKIERILTIEALKNALKFDKANTKAVIGKFMKKFPEYRKKSAEIKPILEKILEQVNSWGNKKRVEELKKLDPNALQEKTKTKPEIRKLPDLSNAIIGDKKSPVVMRLAPYPSGALHIGNARMIVLNDEYVKRYKGRLILCFDDTIGATKKAIKTNPKAKYVLPEAYDLILEGIEWLGINYDKNNIKYKSDRVDIYKKYAEQLINNGDAYVCTCKADVFREKFKKLGKNCPCRSIRIEDHLDRWRFMDDGTFEEGEAAVRLKTGMDQKDPAVRDHIIMRISDAEHPRIGTKTRVWPLLDFSWGIDDHEFGVTHIIRGADLQKEGFIEEFIWDLLGWNKINISLYGRLKFSSDFKLSKTESRIKIKNEDYEGWNDPRTWSLQSLESRGIDPKALRESLLDLGMSMSGINFSEKWLYSKNTKIIDPTSNRYWFVENPLSLEIKDLKRKEYISSPLLNPNNEKLGKRKIVLNAAGDKASVLISKLDISEQRSRRGDKIRFPKMKKGDVFRLKDLFTVKIDEIKPNGSKICATFLTEEVEKNIRKIQWVPKKSNCTVKILKPDGKITEGSAELNMKSLPISTVLQFERYGYVRIIENRQDYIYCYFSH